MSLESMESHLNDDNVSGVSHRVLPCKSPILDREAGSRQKIPRSIVNRTTRLFEGDPISGEAGSQQRPGTGDRPSPGRAITGTGDRPSTGRAITVNKPSLPERPPPITKKPMVDVKPKVTAPKPKLVYDKEGSHVRRPSADNGPKPVIPSKGVVGTASKLFEDGRMDNQASSKEGSPTHSIKSSHSSDGSEGSSIMDRIKLFHGQSELDPALYAKVDLSVKKKYQEDVEGCGPRTSTNIASPVQRLQMTPDRDKSLGEECATLKVAMNEQDISASGQSPSPLSPQSGPPRKPPRTFAHDNYVVQKQLRHKQKKALKELRNSGEVITDSKSVPKTDSSGYEIVDFIDGDDRNHKSPQGNAPSLPVSTPAKVNSKCSTVPRIPNGKVDRPIKRPEERPPPPPRPPPPSPRSTLPGSTEHDTLRWEKPHVNVKQHNEKLPKAAFLGKGKVSNPSYEADWNIIRIKNSNSEGDNESLSGLKRCRSDECLYAEPISYADHFNEPVYCDPIDVVRSTMSPGHQVVFDGDGYAIPEHRHTPPPTHSHHKPLHRMNTVVSGKPIANRYNKAAGNYLKSPTATGARLRPQARKRPHVQEKLSEAYSVLRLNLVSSGDSEDNTSQDKGDDSDNEVDPNEHQQRLQYVSTVKLRLSMAVQQSPRRTPEELSIKLFHYAAIIGLEKTEDCNRFKTKVFFHFPQQSNKELEIISQFCFPDLQVWRPVTIYKSEIFSFVLTDAEAKRRYGYCMRALPPGSGNRLPQVFCIVSALDAFTFYNKLLCEIQQKNKISEEYAEMLIQAAFATPLPHPGKEAWVRSMGLNEKRETIILKRPADVRQENVSFSTLLSNLSIENLLKVFASVLLERKIIFVAQHLSTLTSCIHAVCALLYPFMWPHPFIPVLPEAMIEVCQSPTPIIVGVLTILQPKLVDLHLDQVLMIDLDHNTLMMSQADESRIIPKKLQSALKLALRDDGDTSSSRDIIVMESFMRFFVETIGHYTEYVCTQMNGEKIFQKKSFIMSVSSKSIRMFLEWFVETQMFEVFITDKMESGDTSGIFETRILEYREEMRDTPTIKQNMKQMGKKVKNFFIESGDKIKKKFSSNVYI